MQPLKYSSSASSSDEQVKLKNPSKSDIKALKKSSKALAEKMNNAERTKTSGKLLNVAAQKFGEAEELMGKEQEKLKKSWNPLSKATLFLVNNNILNVGKLGDLRKVYNKFDEILGLARQEIDKTLEDRGLYTEKSGEELKSEINKLGGLLHPNSTLVIFSPYTDDKGTILKQYLNGINVTKDAEGNLKSSECLISYLGDKKGDPQFFVAGNTLIGIDELIKFMTSEGDNNTAIYSKEFFDSPEKFY